MRFVLPALLEEFYQFTLALLFPIWSRFLLPNFILQSRNLKKFRGNGLWVPAPLSFELWMRDV